MNPGEALRTHRLLLRTAFAAAHAFAWIFILEYFFILSGDIAASVGRIALLYALSQTVTCLLIPIAASRLVEGIRREIVFGVLSAAAAFVFLAALFSGLFGIFNFVGFIGFSLLLGMYRALYWVPYAVEHNEMKPQKAYLTYEVFIALMPVFAGYLLTFDGVRESWLLAAAGAILILSLIPFIKLPDVYEQFPWGYRETYGRLFSRAHRKLFLNAVIDGIQGAALLLLWPLLIFILTNFSYQLFGLIFSFTFLLFVVTRGWIESTLRHMRIFESLPVRVVLVASAWVGRLFAINPVSIVVADSFAHTANAKISTDHLTFEQTSDAGHYIDQYTTLREIGLTIGRITLCMVVATSVGVFPLSFVFALAFVIAAISAGLSVLLAHTSKVSL